MNHVEHLPGYDGDPFAFKGNAERNFLRITAIHHMREEGFRKLSGKVKADLSIAKVLISKCQLKKRI